MLEYMIAQRKKIEIEKWNEGIRRKADPGTDFVIWWILNHGASFRNAWHNSLCKNCSLNSVCGHEVKIICNKYNLNTSEND
ncbi:MAG: hypothetical protein H6627_07100 [Calditrichae bacterium]|nr:hypothetical protein [Calditrichota bacterium]MCB9058316.1 hypothetical protein [Calditrichia bacterium]